MRDDLSETGSPRHRPQLAPRYRPGQSGNPGGRPRRPFAELIRRATKDGKELAEFYLAILRCERIEVRNPDDTTQTIRRYPTMGERMSAAQWLGAYAFGRPRIMLEVDSQGVQPIFIIRPDPVSPVPAVDAPPPVALVRSGNGHGLP